MFIVHVFVSVKPDRVEDFVKATLQNASNSINEEGIARFDVVQQMNDPTKFVLIEVYRTDQDPALHKETAHYQKWRDSVADMMAQPRSNLKYTNIHPLEPGWD